VVPLADYGAEKSLILRVSHGMLLGEDEPPSVEAAPRPEPHTKSGRRPRDCPFLMAPVGFFPKPHFTATYQSLCFGPDTRNTRTKETNRTSRLITSGICKMAPCDTTVKSAMAGSP
jgi:hypothetical protein